MIKIYCDVCGKEISDTEESGKLVVLERTIFFLKHQKQSDLKPKEFFLCSDCIKAIKDFMNKRNEELKKA